MTQQDPRLASYSKWLIANQDRRDTPEFQKVANAYKQIRANSLSQPQQVTQTSADYNPPGTGFSRAVERGALQTGAGYYAAKGNITANTIRGMSQSYEDLARRTLNEALKRPLDTPIDQSVLDQGMSLSDALNYYSAQGVLNDRQRDAAEERFNLLAVKADDFKENRLEGETQKMEEAFASAGSLMERAQALPKSQRAELYQQALSEAPDTFKGWLSTITDDPIGFMTFAGETVAESAPAIGAGLATTAVTGNPILGSAVMAAGSGLREYGNEVTGFLAENGVDLQDPQQVQALFRNPELMQKAAQRGLTRALVIAAAEAAGQGAVATKLFGGNVLKQTGTQMVTEGGGEALATASVGDEFSLKNTLTEGIIGGASAVPEAAVAGRNLFKKDGTIVDPESLSSQEKRAAADVARMLRSVAGTDGYNLKDVSTGKKSAKAALEAVRGQIVQNIKNLASLDGIKERLDPKKAASLDQLLEQINPATSAVAAGKTKVARSVTEEQFAAIKRLLPPTKEAGELLNALRMSNITTELFQNGQKGGISQYTDVFLPTKMDGGYSISRGIQNAAFGPAAFFSDGTTLGIGVGGRVIDKVTGRRSIIDRFVRKNENKDGLADPGGPSLIALKELQKKLEQQKLDASKQETLELNRALYDEGVDPAGLDGTMDKASPEAQMMLALEVNTPDGRFGPDRTTINSAVQAIIDNPDSPKALVKAAETYLTNIRDGGKIPKLTPLIQAVKREINSNPEVYGRTRASQLSQGPAFSGNAPTPLTVSDGSVNTSSPAYQAGIQRNLTRVDNQRALLNANPTIPAVEKAQLNESLNRLRQPLNNPVVAVQQEIQRLNELGVDPASIDLVLSPIQEAVTSQQRQAQGLQTPTESTQRPALETVTPAPAEAQTEAPAALTQPAPSDPISMTVRANLLTRTVREIAEGNMTPSQVEILLSQLEQSYPGIKAEVEAIIGSQQQQQQQQPALQQPSALQLTPEMQVQPSLELTPEMRQSAEAPSVNNTQPVLPYMQQETVEDDTKFDMEPPAIPALSSDRLTMNFTDVTKRTPELQEGQRKLQSGEITRDEYADLVNEFKPVLPYQTAPAPATVQDAKYALANGKGQSDKKAEKYGEPTKVLQPDQRIQLRLDIPSYKEHGTWVVSVHEPNSRPDSTAEGRFKAGPVIGYESAMAIKNADIGMLQRPAQKIAEGSPKGTIATMLGDYMPMSPSEAQAYQQNAIEQSLQPGSGFAQVGMDPERHSYFYDRNTMQPIVSAEEIVQVGPLVIAKNPQYAPTDDFVFDQEPSLNDRGIKNVSGTSGSNRPALLPALREGRDKLGAKFSRRPQRQEVVAQFPPVKALFEIGKKGSPYENGITNLDQALELARALNITVHLFDNQQKMMDAQGRKNKGTVRGSFRKTPNGASGTVFALKAGSPINEGTVGSLDELTTVLHEIFHGVTMGPMSGEGPMINGNGTNSVENALGAMIDKPQGKRTREEREIIYEVKRLQDQLAAYIEGNPRDRRPVRVLNRALQNLEENRMRMTPEQQMQQEQAIDKYKNYIRTKSEFSVDPFWVYAVNPKLAKQVMPVTTKWIQKNLRQAGNKNIQFYSHPFAVSVAVIMAILAAQDAEDEEKKQQQQQQQPMMQPGALSPMQGMLTAA